MRVLALDTTTAAGSLALVHDDRVVEEQDGDLSRPHAARLPGDAMALLQRHGLGASDVDVFAVASGPGSFTGLRIGIAMMQGLAVVTRRPVVGVSALAALAHAAGADLAEGLEVAAWMDAHRGEVFSAIYRVGAARPFSADRLEELETAAVGSPDTTLDRWADLRFTPAVFVGDGAVRYRGAIEQRPRPGVSILDPPALAGAIGRIAAGLAARGEATDPAAIRPLYVRRPDAEIARAAKA